MAAKYCAELVNSAIRERYLAKGSHNFTGNLLNSIVVGLYRYGKPYVAFYAASNLKRGAIARKMTFRKRRAYKFNPDYDNVKSSYLPKVKTDKGWGEEDARNFFYSYKANQSNMYEVVVAYPVEYASWIELQRKTTGILGTYESAKTLKVTCFKVG